MLRPNSEELFNIFFVIIPIVIVAIQLYRFIHAKEDYQICYKDYMALLRDYGKKISKMQETGSSPSVNSGMLPFGHVSEDDDGRFPDESNRSPLLRMLSNDSYEWFISYRNTKTELFKSYVIVPLELYFYIIFMISVIYTLGSGIKLYIDDPLQGFGNLLNELHNNWIGSLIILAIFMHRIVLKKIENLKKFKDAEF